MDENKEKLVILPATGADIVFHFQRTGFPQQARLYVTIDYNHEDTHIHIKSVTEIVEKREIVNLCEYLLQHIDKSKENHSHRSEIYVDHTMLYHVRAYEGGWGIDDDTNEEYLLFTLELFVNVEQPKGKARVYIGYQGQVDSRDIERFSEHIRK